MTNKLTEYPSHIGYNKSSRKAFFTDTSVCIGCKACEVACKEWNRLPADNFGLTGDSYDNTGDLGHSTWRHVAFIEQDFEQIDEAKESGKKLVGLGMPTVGSPTPANDKTTTIDLGGYESPVIDTPDFRWLIASDVCKHCTNAGCLDVCPTGALFRTEFGTVVVQDNVCNGCGTCVAGCPFGVIERREDGTIMKTDAREGEDFTPGEKAPIKNIGVAQKCTMCYDRLKDGLTPSCQKACPTESIQFGDREEMLARAQARVDELHAQGRTEARLYGANSGDGVGGTGSIFLLLDEPEVYGLPPDPEVPTRNLPEMLRNAAIAAGGMAAAVAASFVIGRRS